MQSGFTRLSKPVKPADLLDAVQRLLAVPLASKRNVAPGPPVIVSGDRKAIKIFIVDDDSGVRDATRAFLEKAGYDVAVFASAAVKRSARPAHLTWRPGRADRPKPGEHHALRVLPELRCAPQLS